MRGGEIIRRRLAAPRDSSWPGYGRDCVRVVEAKKDGSVGLCGEKTEGLGGGFGVGRHRLCRWGGAKGNFAKLKKKKTGLTGEVAGAQTSAPVDYPARTRGSACGRTAKGFVYKGKSDCWNDQGGKMARR